MSWGKTATKEPEAPKYGREHMRAMLERQKSRVNRTPVRMALVGKENTCKTLTLTIPPEKRLLMFTLKQRIFRLSPFMMKEMNQSLTRIILPIGLH